MHRPRSAKKGSPSPQPPVAETSHQQWPSPPRSKPRSPLAGLDTELSRRVAQYASAPSAPAGSSLALELELLR